MTDEELIDKLRKACGYMIGEGDARAVLAIVTPELRRRAALQAWTALSPFLSRQPDAVQRQALAIERLLAATPEPAQGGADGEGESLVPNHPANQTRAESDHDVDCACAWDGNAECDCRSALGVGGG